MRHYNDFRKPFLETAMTAMKKILIIHVILILISSLYAAETVFVPQNSLLFSLDKDKKNLRLQAKAQKDFDCEVIKKEKVILPLGSSIIVFADAHQLKIPGPVGLFYFPTVDVKEGKNGILTFRVDKIDPLMILGFFIFVTGLASLAGYFRLKSEKKKYLLPAAVVLFFWAYAVWYIGFVSDSYICPSDEVYYFDIAEKILARDFSSLKFRYTVGFPLLYIPFMVLFNLSNNQVQFFPVFMNFQTFILIPGLFLILYRFFNKRMELSRIKSFCILLLWQFLIVFYTPMFILSDKAAKYLPDNYCNDASFSLIRHNYDYIFFQLTWLGRNSMSDYAAVFLLVVLLYCSMQKSRSLIRFFLLSMGFGFLCLIRINYIFFAPLLAFVFYDSFSELWKNTRNYLYAALCGTAGFMMVFIWQFVLNKIQLGSPFVWPHSLHEFAPDRGFVWNVIPYGFKFLCQNNYVYIVLGISSLFFIPDRKIRAFLTLWIFPMLLFFTGYPIVFNSPVRFIFALYPPMLAAVVMNPVWQAAWPVRIKAALVVFSSCLLCKSNIFYPYSQPWNLESLGMPGTVFMVIQGVVCLFCCAVIISMRKELKTDYANTIRHFRFLILYTAVFFLGSVCIYIAGILVLAAFIYGVRETFLHVRQIRENPFDKNVGFS